jgi:hypothetical protein
MPKKSAAARSGAPRTKKTQKSFELVRPEGATQDETTTESFTAEEADLTSDNNTVAAVATPEPEPLTVAEVTSADDDDNDGNNIEIAPVAPKNMSASARLAARRKASQRAQQRQAASLITAEHFSYVRRDLTIIGSLAVVMFAAIIILYFVLV